MNMRKRKRAFWSKFVWFDGELWGQKSFWGVRLYHNECGRSLPKSR